MAKIYLLNNLKFEDVVNIELFSIEYIKTQIDMSSYDAIVFTSKNAVYSISSNNNDWKKFGFYR